MELYDKTCDCGNIMKCVASDAGTRVRYCKVCGRLSMLYPEGEEHIFHPHFLDEEELEPQTQEDE